MAVSLGDRSGVRSKMMGAAVLTGLLLSLVGCGGGHGGGAMKPDSSVSAANPAATKSTAPTTAATTKAQKTPAQAPTTKTKAPKTTPSPERDGTHFVYGEVAHYDSGRRTTIPLELTVTAPTVFQPSDQVSVSASDLGQPAVLHEVCFYVVVTIKNLSPDKTYEYTFDRLEPGRTGSVATPLEHSRVRDGDVTYYAPFRKIGPGQTLSYKPGFSVASMDQLEMRLSLDGQAGKTFYFAPSL